MTTITQADRDLFITITNQDDHTADDINLGRQYRWEVEQIAKHREAVELRGFSAGTASLNDAVAVARMEERAAIVAWLREQDGHGYDDVRAYDIEGGEHLK